MPAGHHPNHSGLSPQLGSDTCPAHPSPQGEAENPASSTQTRGSLGIKMTWAGDAGHPGGRRQAGLEFRECTEIGENGREAVSAEDQRK